VGHIRHPQVLICQKRTDQYRQGRIFCAPDADLASQRPAAPDD